MPFPSPLGFGLAKTRLAALAPVIAFLWAGAAFGEIKVSHNTNINLLCPLKLTLSPGSGETGWSRVTIRKEGPGQKTETKKDSAAAAWVQFQKPRTITLAPQAERDYAVDYYSVGADGVNALTDQFRQLGIPFTFYELNIGHGQSASWRLKGDEALQFIAAHFK